jgi:hypothetical protein
MLRIDNQRRQLVPLPSTAMAQERLLERGDIQDLLVRSWEAFVDDLGFPTLRVLGQELEVIEEVVILKAAQAQREARKKADLGDYDGAQEMLRSSAKELRGMAPKSARAQELIAEAEMMEGHAAMASPASWDATSSKNLHYNEHRIRQSRRSPPEEQR